MNTNLLSGKWNSQHISIHRNTSGLSKFHPSRLSLHPPQSKFRVVLNGIGQPKHTIIRRELTHHLVVVVVLRRLLVCWRWWALPGTYRYLPWRRLNCGKIRSWTWRNVVVPLIKFVSMSNTEPEDEAQREHTKDASKPRSSRWPNRLMNAIVPTIIISFILYVYTVHPLEKHILTI